MEKIWPKSDLEAVLSAKLQKDYYGAVKFNSQEVVPGDIFVALPGGIRDSHIFVQNAYEMGASLCIVNQKIEAYDGQEFVVVADPYEALLNLAKFKRDRSKAKFIGVTGSVGKTTTKELLHHMLKNFGKTISTYKNYNNHLGVPLTLASMPDDTEFAVIEMGMNHAHEIDFLSKIARPDIAVITTVEAIHLENFESVAGICDAKCEIFDGMKAGNIVILNGDNAYIERQIDTAKSKDLVPFLFGNSENCDYKISDSELNPTLSFVLSTKNSKVNIKSHFSGRHNAYNIASSLAVIDKIGLDIKQAASTLEDFYAGAGRGEKITAYIDGKEITLIDDSYNAGPASMTASIIATTNLPGRKILVLGEMRELGPDSIRYHEEIAQFISNLDIDLVLCCCGNMKYCFAKLPESMKGGFYESSSDLLADLPKYIKSGDIVLVKGSNGTGLYKNLQKLKPTIIKGPKKNAL